MPADDVQANNMPTATIAEQHTINGRRTIGFFAMDNRSHCRHHPHRNDEHAGNTGVHMAGILQPLGQGVHDHISAKHGEHRTQKIQRHRIIRRE